MDFTKVVFDGMQESEIIGAGADLLVGIILILFLWSLVRIFRTKRIYFVRHGETVLNAAHIRQDSHGELNETGRAQARATGIRLAHMHIQHMYVSPFERTVETAGIINESVHTPFTYTRLLVERRNPSVIVGKKYDDIEVKHITDAIDLGYHDENFRIADEENFLDLKRRARKLLRYIAFRPYTSIVCVTHGIYLKMVLAYITTGRALDVPTYINLAFLHKVDNAGITLVTHNPWRFLIGEKNWQIVVFNDVSKV